MSIKEWGAEFRRLRKARGGVWTLGYVANKCGIDDTRLSRYENGLRIPPIRTAYKMIQLIGSPELYTSYLEIVCK